MGVLTGMHPEITLVVHPINTAAHPSVPPGWRWAVQVGGGRPDDLERCANAGWCPDEHSARLEGEQNAATALNAVRMFGVPATSRTLTLDHDPIPAGGDLIRHHPAPPACTGPTGFGLET